MIRFSGRIHKIGINPVVDPPDLVMDSLFAEAKRSKGPIPVQVTINGEEFVQTLVKFRSAWRLYINGEMLKASGLKVGDAADIEIKYDPRPREPAMPDELARALREDRSAREQFDGLTSSRRKEILGYLNSLRSAEAMRRNVEKIIRQLHTE